MREPKEIGRIVRGLRGSVSLREFAKKCDMSHTTIDNIEKGIDFRTGKPTQIKITTLQKIASACGVPIAYIIGDTEEFREYSLNDISLKFGEILKRLRVERKYTQEELAKELKIASSTVSMYERGERTPDYEMLETIADFFGVDMNYLHARTSLIDPPASSEENDEKRELLNRIGQMDDDQLKQLSDFADYLIDKKK